MKKEGEHKEYYENGQIKSVGTYKNGKKNGIFEEFAENGDEISRISFKNDVLHGEYITYSIENDSITKGKYVKGNREGLFTEEIEKEGYYKFKEENYINDIKDGAYFISESQSHGVYESTAIEEKGTYKKGLKDGPFKIKDKASSTQEYLGLPIIIEGFYRQGKLHGAWKRNASVHRQEKIYDNGNLKSYHTFKNDKKTCEEIYYNSGKIKSRAFYENGSLHGEFMTFYKNGKLKLSINYKDGQKHGFSASYLKNGEFDFQKEYINGIENN